MKIWSDIMRRGSVAFILTTLILSVLVALAALVTFGWFSWFDDEPAAEKIDKPVAEAKSANQEKAPDDDDQNKDKEPVRGVIYAGQEWTEHIIMRTLHEMTHQKIRADQKWGAVAMTKENVQTMIRAVQDHKGSLDHYDLYMGMLNDWKAGDFSQADKQHNQLWKLEGGNVGKARGLLSKEEEQDYIEEYFDNGVGTFEW